MDYLSRMISLEPIGQHNLEPLLKYRNSATFRQLCSKRRDIVSATEFLAELRSDFTNDRLQQALICRRDGRSIGTIYAYGYSHDDGYLFVTVYLEQQVRNHGYGVAAFRSFCKILFAQYDLYKIYLDVYEHNTAVVALLRREGLMQEGCFRGHRREGEKRFDVFRFALYRSRFEVWEQH